MTERNCIAASYRFFGVNDLDVVLWDASSECLDDDEARATATKRSREGLVVEVWDVARLVTRCGGAVQTK